MAIYSELLFNGDFSYGFAAWKDASISPGSASVVDGKCLLQSGSGGKGVVEYDIHNLTYGATYRVSLNVSGTNSVMVVAYADGSTYLNSGSLSPTGNGTLDFNMLGSSLKLVFENASTSNQSVEIDDVSLTLKHSKWTGAVDDDFSNHANWDGNSPGSDTLAVWPGGNAANCTFDQTVSVSEMLVEDGYTGTIDAADENVSVDSDVEILCGGGTVLMGSGLWSIGGDYNAQAGTLGFGSSTVQTFGDFTISADADIVAGSDAMNGASITVGGACSLSGQTGSPLNLRGTAEWSLDISGAAQAQYCDVSYCDASGGTLIRTWTSIDGGGNQGWSFAVDGPYRTADGQVFSATAAAGEISG